MCYEKRSVYLIALQVAASILKVLNTRFSMNSVQQDQEKTTKLSTNHYQTIRCTGKVAEKKGPLKLVKREKGRGAYQPLPPPPVSTAAGS